VVAAVELDVQRLSQDHLPLAAHPGAVMIKAMVTVIWLSPGAPQVVPLLIRATSATSCGALGLGDVKLGALLEPPQQ
jgi:hypothetical protein